MDDIPSCPAGIALLHDLATAHPGAFAVARQRSFIDPPMLGSNPRRQLFAQHRSTCADCSGK